MATDEKTPPQMAFEVNVRTFDLSDTSCGKSVQLLRVVRDEDPRAAIIGALAEEDCAAILRRTCKCNDLPVETVESLLRSMVAGGKAQKEPTVEPAPAAEAP